MGGENVRLDVYMTDAGLVPSRAKAQEMIKNGCVAVNQKVINKPSYELSTEDSVSLRENPLQRYVGRGGLKLECALRTFGISPEGLVAVDIGASSGGFTDCLLQHGAAFVYAVDSGEGQLHPKLLADEHVENREHTNARYLSKNDFERTPSLAVMDVSFISQTLILPSVADILREGGTLITLIKPQFELDRTLLGKGGIVKSEKLRRRAIERVKASAEVLGFHLDGCVECDVHGGDGNVEYLAVFTVNQTKERSSK